MDVEEQAHDLRAAGAEPDRLARLALGDTPDLRVVERAVLDFSGYAGPAPRRVDLVQQRPRRILEPRAPGFFGLEVVAFEAGPALQRIVVPAAAGEVLIAMKV